MAPNLHARNAANGTRYSYDEVRRAVNLLVGWDVANRENSERMVDEWIAEDVPDLVARATATIKAVRT